MLDQPEDLQTEVEEDLSTDPTLSAVLAHMTTLKGKVTVEDLDFLLAKMAETDAKQKELAKIAAREGKIMTRMKFIATSILKDLGRQDFKSPRGTVSIK